MDQLTQPGEVRRPAQSSLSLTFWWFLFGALALMCVLLGFGAPPWMFGGAAAVMFLLGLALVDSCSQDGVDATTPELPDAASPEEHHAALEHLARLPQFRRLTDGSLFDYLRGSTVTLCTCGQYSAFHLLVSYCNGERYRIALVTRSALNQYVALQTAVGGAFRPWLPESGIVRPHPTQEGGDA